MFINLNRFKTSRLAKAISSLFLDFTATNTLDDRVTFSRTSNATVTNSAGLIAYAPHNLLTFSEQFDNAAWSKTNLTVTANTSIAPNNTTTADKLVASGGAVDHLIDQNSPSISTGVIINESIYAKASECTEIRVRIGNAGAFSGAPQAVTFTLTGSGSGVVEQGTPTFSITSVGNGWYRCSITATAVATGAITIRFSPSISRNTSFDANGSGIFVWGAQLELGASPTAYNPTTVKNLLGFSELFDNAAWTKSNSFVQTNLLTYSEDFSNSAWVNFNTTETANTVIAPNGYQTADTLDEGTANNVHQITQGFAYTSGVNYTLSVYAKYVDNPYIYLSATKYDSGNTYASAAFNIQTGAFVTSASLGTGWSIVGTPTITPVGNGWYRCGVTITAGTGSTSGNSAFFIYQGSTGTIGSFGGESYTGTNRKTYLWGAQLVQGSVAGDYRRTDAAALPVYYPNHNGVVVAEKLVENTVNGAHSLQYPTLTISSQSTYTYSFYAKKEEITSLEVWLCGASTVNRTTAIFNLNDGTSSGNAVGNFTNSSAFAQPVGNGWYRCSVKGTVASGETGVRVITYLSKSGVITYTGDGTSGIYIFGAQLSDSASLDPYVLTAGAAPTAAAYYGPRFDYDPVTLQPKGLLIEEQRSNLLLNSSLAGTNLATQSVTVTAVAHTLSFYGTGTVTLSGTAIAVVVGTGAYPTRTTLTFTPTVGVVVFTVTGTVQFAQLEIGSFATSFIPTAASQVTRTADVATIQGSNFYSWYNQNEGSLFINSKVDDITGFKGLVSLDTDAGNFIDIRCQNSGSSYRAPIVYNTIDQGTFEFGTTYSATQFIKTAVGYKQNDSAGVTTGVSILTDTLCTIPMANKLKLGDVANFKLNGTIKQISYYPIRLADTVLQGLTT